MEYGLGIRGQDSWSDGTDTLGKFGRSPRLPSRASFFLGYEHSEGVWHRATFRRQHPCFWNDRFEGGEFSAACQLYVKMRNSGREVHQRFISYSNALRRLASSEFEALNCSVDQHTLNPMIEADYAFLPGVPSDVVVRRLNAAGGNEVSSGKLSSLESSAALAVNTFGWFIARPELLPAFPMLQSVNWPATQVEVEYCARFPWSGGKHPWLDAWVETPTAIIGVESKRFEPYRDRKDEINIHLSTTVIDQSGSRGYVVTPSLILKTNGDILLKLLLQVLCRMLSEFRRNA
jgi:hypothetical protein